MRKLLNPILKLFFNPNPLIEALHIQSKLNAQQAALEPLYYEVIHNLVLETTRLGIDVKNLKMRVESMSSRLDFDETASPRARRRRPVSAGRRAAAAAANGRRRASASREPTPNRPNAGIDGGAGADGRGLTIDRVPAGAQGCVRVREGPPRANAECERVEGPAPSEPEFDASRGVQRATASTRTEGRGRWEDSGDRHGDRRTAHPHRTRRSEVGGGSDSARRRRSLGIVKLAVAVQRYGADINGGAELHARYVAERLARHAEVEVVTTCARDYVTWRNERPAGVEHVNGVPVRRFPVTHERESESLRPAVAAGVRPAALDRR